MRHRRAYELAPPVCKPVAITTQAGAAVPVTPSCADPAGVTVAYAATAGPLHGTLSGLDTTGGKVTYSPAAGFSGTDTFTYLATGVNGTANSVGGSKPATLAFTIVR
ncbi:MAG: Ig-like domain-containing protein [Solirubrobacteraceae bacterium]